MAMNPLKVFLFLAGGTVAAGYGLRLRRAGSVYLRCQGGGSRRLPAPAHRSCRSEGRALARRGNAAGHDGREPPADAAAPPSMAASPPPMTHGSRPHDGRRAASRPWPQSRPPSSRRLPRRRACRAGRADLRRRACRGRRLDRDRRQGSAQCLGRAAQRRDRARQHHGRRRGRFRDHPRRAAEARRLPDHAALHAARRRAMRRSKPQWCRSRRRRAARCWPWSSSRASRAS